MTIPKTGKYILFCLAAFGWWSVTATGWSAGNPPAAAYVHYEHERLTLDVRNAPLLHVLEKIARQSGVSLFMDPRLKEVVSLKLREVSLEEAIRRLCQSASLEYAYDPGKRSYRILRIGAYAQGGDGSTSTPANISALSSGESLHAPPHTASSAKADLSPVRSGAQERPAYRAGELLVRLREGADGQRLRNLHASMGSKVLRTLPRYRLQRVRLAPHLTEGEAMTGYAASDLVESAGRHPIRYLHATPDDPLFPKQWALHNETGVHIDAAGAWEKTKGSAQVVIAVIDTGVDHTHPDMRTNMWVNPGEIPGNGIDDDLNGYVDDVYGWDFGGVRDDDPEDADADPRDRDGHGTSVAALIAAAGNNGVGGSGVCWNARIMALKVTADDSNRINQIDVIEAIGYAIANGAALVNCSFGGDYPDTYERLAFADLRDAGILASCAAGNAGRNLDTSSAKNYPSGYDLDNIVAVAASDANDALAAFSNYGKISVDLMAPGQDVYAVVSAYVALEGTEYRANHVENAGSTFGITARLFDCGAGWADDFPPEVAGNLALVARDRITEFREKASNARAAGALGVIIYNDDSSSLDWTLQDPAQDIPVVAVSNTDGLALRAAASATPIVTVVDTGLTVSTRGTSMATPHVTGAAGLVLARFPSLLTEEYRFKRVALLRGTLLKRVDPVEAVGNKLASGGRLNARAALELFGPGDLTLDDAVALDDAVTALQVMGAGAPARLAEWLQAGVDVNGDAAIGVQEVIYILQRVSGVREAGH